MCNQEFRTIWSGDIVKYIPTGMLYKVLYKDVLPLDGVKSLYGFRCVSIIGNGSDVFLHKKNYYQFGLVKREVPFTSEIILAR